MIIGHMDGAILLAVFAAFLVWMVLSAKKARDAAEEEEIKTMPVWKCAVCIVVGIAAIVIGGDFVVDSASGIAAAFGLSQTLIGLTIVAFGTSLPELVTSMVAAQKGENDLALGNVVGSNIFNILLILGASSAISPITIDGEAVFDMLLLIVMSMAAYVFTRSNGKLSKKEGSCLLVMYALYFVYIYLR